jgi:predicted phosphodiesterase
VPFEDKRRVRAALEWGRKNKPDRIVLLGDVLELHAVSTHRQDPRWIDRLECELDAGYEFLRQLREANPKAEITFIEGNHEKRLTTYVQGRAPAIRTLGANLPQALQLDELGIKWHDSAKGVRIPTGQGQVFYAYHGDHVKRSSKFPAGVALGLAEQLGRNVICGHTHKYGVMAGKCGRKTVFGIEAGCLINAKHSIFGYAGPRPTWTHAFLVADSEQSDSPLPRPVFP